LAPSRGLALGSQRAWIAGTAGEHLDRHGAAVTGARQADDLLPVAFAIAEWWRPPAMAAPPMPRHITAEHAMEALA
jgi:hypothetical protein